MRNKKVITFNLFRIMCGKYQLGKLDSLSGDDKEVLICKNFTSNFYYAYKKSKCCQSFCNPWRKLETVEEAKVFNSRSFHVTLPL